MHVRCRTAGSTHLPWKAPCCKSSAIRPSFAFSVSLPVFHCNYCKCDIFAQMHALKQCWIECLHNFLLRNHSVVPPTLLCIQQARQPAVEIAVQSVGASTRRRTSGRPSARRSGGLLVGAAFCAAIHAHDCMLSGKFDGLRKSAAIMHLLTTILVYTRCVTLLSI